MSKKNTAESGTSSRVELGAVVKVTVIGSIGIVTLFSTVGYFLYRGSKNTAGAEKIFGVKDVSDSPVVDIQQIGNGICDDVANTEEHDWDGGHHPVPRYCPSCHWESRIIRDQVY